MLSRARISINIDDVVKGLDKKKENSRKVVERTVNEMRSMPPKISKVVRKEYTINKADFDSSMHIQKMGGINIGGHVVDNISIIYKGRLLTLTHFKFSPHSRPAKKYKVKTTIKKGNKRTLNNRTFIAHSHGEGSKSLPFQRDRGVARTPIRAVRTLSAPQMVQDGKGNTKPEIENLINENLEKRFKHHCDHLLK